MSKWNKPEKLTVSKENWRTSAHLPIDNCVQLLEISSDQFSAVVRKKQTKPIVTLFRTFASFSFSFFTYSHLTRFYWSIAVRWTLIQLRVHVGCHKSSSICIYLFVLIFDISLYLYLSLSISFSLCLCWRNFNRSSFTNSEFFLFILIQCR